MNSNYSINEFAKRVGCSVQTVRRWEKRGKLTAKRLPSGHRYFDESDVRALLGSAPEKKDIVVYCRVSSAGQKDDLASQVRASVLPLTDRHTVAPLGLALMMEEYCREVGVRVDVMVKDLMAIVHTFSRRLYGMRKHVNQVAILSNTDEK